jgi:hypothetical protein
VNAISVLESGNIFFNEDSVTGSRTFIERELTPHIFWRDLSFWRFMLESSINDRIKVFILPTQPHRPILIPFPIVHLDHCIGVPSIK